jgi:hypothetical protein
MAKQRILACPLCGETQYEQTVCKQCGGKLDPDGLLLAEASFGPWYVRDEDNPFAPGMTYDLLVQKIGDETLHRFSLVRGPTTRQLWIIAKRVPGIAHLLGRCHRCDEHVDPASNACHMCEVAFGGYRSRDSLGLEETKSKKVEATGLSSFLGDTAIFETCSEPLSVPTRPQVKNAPLNSEVSDEPGSPAFRSLQRHVDGVKRTNRILMVVLGVVCLILVLLLVNG